MVRDDLLVEIARRDLTRLLDLEVVRGLSKRELPAILAVVERVAPRRVGQGEDPDTIVPVLPVLA